MLKDRILIAGLWLSPAECFAGQIAAQSAVNSSSLYELHLFPTADS